MEQRSKLEWDKEKAEREQWSFRDVVELPDSGIEGDFDVDEEHEERLRVAAEELGMTEPPDHTSRAWKDFFGKEYENIQQKYKMSEEEFFMFTGVVFNQGQVRDVIDLTGSPTYQQMIKLAIIEWEERIEDNT